MNPGDHTIELPISTALLVDIRALLEQEGHDLSSNGRDIGSPFALSNELARRRVAAIDITVAILAILQRHAIKPLDLDVQDAGRRLALAAPQS